MSNPPVGSTLNKAKEDIKGFLEELMPDFQFQIKAGYKNNIIISRVATNDLVVKIST